ncbi:MAG: TlpA disulfide reductase family protein [Methylovulum sp.]|nr:TlpA disulfide reductase family protein [Methylovulum sp.]
MPIKYKISGLLALALALLWLVSLLMPLNVPDDTFTTLTGRKIALKGLRGKPVVVTFWATDCPSCIKEIPDLIAIYQQYHKQGLELIAVNMYYDPPSHVVDTASALQLPYPVALDITGGHAQRFGGVYLTPSTFVINPDGAITRRYTGTFDPVELSTHIENLLKG